MSALVCSQCRCSDYMVILRVDYMFSQRGVHKTVVGKQMHKILYSKHILNF